MKFIGRLFLCGMMAVALMQAACANPPATMTAQLTIDGDTCSGTVVGLEGVKPSNVILSAAHCFRDDELKEMAELLGIKYKAPPLPTTMLVDDYKVQILAVVFDESDHALVKTDFFFSNHSSLGKRPEVGARIHYWGNPDGVSNVYREGYVTSVHSGEMFMDVNGFFGDSGSGIFDESGKVVGVISSINYHRHQGLTFSLMGANDLEFTPMQYSMMNVSAP